MRSGDHGLKGVCPPEADAEGGKKKGNKKNEEMYGSIVGAEKRRKGKRKCVCPPEADAEEGKNERE